MLKILAKGVSVIFHPLFIISYVLLFALLVNPYAFGFNDAKSRGLVIISVVMLSFFFPVISILMMKLLGLISGFEMPDRRERIGPIVATGIFYLWLYVNIRQHDLIPSVFSCFLLGAIIGLFAGLVLNNFSKISLHALAAGGLLAGMFLLVSHFTYPVTEIQLPLFQRSYMVRSDFFLLVVIVITGLIGSSRLFLKAHTENELYGGYLTGIAAQWIAFNLYF